jgi:uncharacterized membrane protein
MDDPDSSAARPAATERDIPAEPQFWYSPGTALSIVAALLLLILAVSCLIPPFQASDEFYHVQRAYRLAKGQLILHPENGVTAAQFDTGLLDYMRNFQNVRWFTYSDAKRRAQSSPYLCMGTEIRWSGKVAIERVPNTAGYFPLPYAPQALAFAFGERADLSVSQSYYLARICSLVAALTLLWAAMLVYPMPLVVLALFLTPMTFIQLGSATLDAVAFALCALAIALFLRGCNQRYSFGPGLHAAMCACLFALATSRPNLIAFALLPAMLYFVRRARIHLFSSAALLIVSAAWLGLVGTTVNSGNGHDPLISSAIVHYYVTHLTALFKVLIATISDTDLLRWYWHTFVGMVGWTADYLDSRVYVAWGILLPLLALSSLRWRRRGVPSKPTLALVGCSVAAFLLMLLMELVTWTPHPARVVANVLGRHFTPLLIPIGYALFGASLAPRMLKIGLVTLFLMTAVTTVGLARQLLISYWIVEPRTVAVAPGLPQPTDCGTVFLDAWFDLRGQNRCTRAGLEITSQLLDASGKRELCPAK